jgi:hypothetical protein
MPVRVAQSLTASFAMADFDCQNAARHRGFRHHDFGASISREKIGRIKGFAGI